MPNDYLIYAITGMFYFACELLYFRIGKRFRLTDTPNNRSSHSVVTITGAGFIFPLAFVLPLLFTGQYIHYRALMTGLFLLTCISFLDDLRALNKKSRITVQILAVGLLLWQTGGLFKMTIWSLIPAFIFVVGMINAYNFMDGINGITGLYSLVTVLTVFYLQDHGFPRLPVTQVFISLIASLLVFLFFNARKKAVCFCGDVGSITMAFIISFFIIQLMIFDDNGKWILLIGVYGLDAVATIVLRLIRGENIGQAHRTHFYQFLAVKKKIPHLLISCYYAFVQLGINAMLVFTNSEAAVTFYVITVIGYIVLRLKLEGKQQLFVSYDS